MTYQTEIVVNGARVKTLQDILPSSGPMKMLIVAKTPAPVSVAAGHYFQGKQGQMLWNRLSDHGLLRVPPGKFHDEVLLDHCYGITDIVKVPREYGNEPSDGEYRQGVDRILGLVKQLKPCVLMFVYKRVLDQLLELAFRRMEKSKYGFNLAVDALFGTRVFAFPMPGTPCTKAEAQVAMRELVEALRPSFGLGHRP